MRAPAAPVIMMVRRNPAVRCRAERLHRPEGLDRSFGDGVRHRDRYAGCRAFRDARSPGPAAPGRGSVAGAVAPAVFPAAASPFRYRAGWPTRSSAIFSRWAAAAPHVLWSQFEFHRHAACSATRSPACRRSRTSPTKNAGTGPLGVRQGAPPDPPSDEAEVALTEFHELPSTARLRGRTTRRSPPKPAPSERALGARVGSGRRVALSLLGAHVQRPPDSRRPPVRPPRSRAIRGWSSTARWSRRCCSTCCGTSAERGG